MKRSRIPRVALLVSTALFALSATSFAREFPPPAGFVNDFAGVISARQESEIARIATEVKRATGAEIAVATFDSLGDYASIESFAIALASEWGIGESGKDNGVLLVVAMAERKTRIEVGYGLEGALPDGLVGRIMDTSMLPYFRNDDFGTGFLKATEGIAGVIAKEYDVELPDLSLAESRKYEQTGSGGTPNLFPILIVFFIFFAGGGRFFWPIFFLGGMSRRSGFTRGGFGSSSRGGFGGGGFGGFSGGSFGGGGASRGF